MSNNYNIDIYFTKEAAKHISKTRCPICNKKVQHLKPHQETKYCLAVKKVLDKLTPLEVGLLKTGKHVPYYY